jgi:hypothetical protein
MKFVTVRRKVLPLARRMDLLVQTVGYGKRSFISDYYLRGVPMCLTEGYFCNNVPSFHRIAQRGFRDAVEYFQNPDNTRWTHQALAYINRLKKGEHAGSYWCGARQVETLLLSAAVPTPSWVCSWRR